MIVVAIIALIAAIAIPNLLRARHNANEAAAIGNMKTLVNALESFRANTGAYPPGNDLTPLSSANPPYVDATLTRGTRQGYNFRYNGRDNNRYELRADPVNAGVTGTRHFFVDESGVIRVSQSGSASASSPPLE
jgi:type II secretory pathway pseudopilin PulG